MDHRYVQLTELEQCYDAVIWDVTGGSSTIVEAFRATTMRELLNELYSSAQLEDDDAVLWHDGSFCSFGEAMSYIDVV